MTQLTLNGNTYADDGTNRDLPTGWRTWFLACLSDLLAHLASYLTSLGGSLTATSATNSVAIGTGSKTLTVQAGKGFTAGMWVNAADASNAASSMAGVVTAYNSGTGALTFTVAAADVSGSGTPAGWNVTISGKTGPSGGVNTFAGRSGAVTPQAGDYVASDVGAVGQGLHTIAIPAGALKARTTNGPTLVTEETTTNKVMVVGLDFDPTTAQYAQAVIPMPKSANLAAGIAVQFVWKAGSGSGNAVWAAQAQWQRDGDVLDSAWGTAQSVTDALIATADRHISAATATITPAGTAGTGCDLLVQVYRDALNGSDTLAVNARLVGVRITYSINAATDA